VLVCPDKKLSTAVTFDPQTYGMLAYLESLTLSNSIPMIMPLIKLRVKIRVKVKE